ncbi:MAG TPA: glycosyltransferase [Bryobacteraceae bacterium]|nr:glycosyltransferase [Bryobacteraceae bacterium]
MRILHILRTLDPAWGGPVEGARNLTDRALARGYTVEIACLDDPQSAWIPFWRPTIHALGRRRSMYGFNRHLDGWLAANLSRFDAVVVHSIWMYFSYAVWSATRRVRVPYFLLIHGALDPWFKAQYPLKHVKKTLYWNLLEHKVLRDAEAVLFTTEEEQRLAHNAFQPYHCRPAVIGYGILEPKADPTFDKRVIIEALTASNPALRNRDFILFLGRIHEKKGVDLLLKAFAAVRRFFPRTAIVIAGPGSNGQVAPFKNLAASLGIADDVIWPGALYGDVKYNTMRAADAYILPSHQENFGISVVESLACRTPVLISNKVNIWREIQRAGAGLIEPDDLEGSTQLLKNWAALTPAEKSAMRVSARACFDENFDITFTSDRFFSVILSGARRSLEVSIPKNNNCSGSKCAF